MKAGPQIATAVVVGYALGRTRKMKLAIAIGSMMAGRRLTTNPGEIFERGIERIASSPQASRLTGELRDQLLNAVKAAAVATASNKIESLGDSISKRAQDLRAERTEEQSADEGADERDESVPRQREPAKRREAPERGSAGTRQRRR